MITYHLKSLAVYSMAILVALAVVAIPYSLLINTRTLGFLTEATSSPQAVGISMIAAIAPIFAIMEALVSWLKSWRENRVRSELVKVIDAQSTSPKGMDINALERESGLPRRVLQDRVNELILLGRMGVRITPSSSREYYLIGAV
jgi:hypothetical protein